MAPVNWEKLLSGMRLAAKWRFERSPIAREHMLAFHCIAGGRVMLSDNALEDAKRPELIVVEAAERLYHGQHVVPPSVPDIDLALACPSCRLVSVFPDDAKADLAERFTRAEQQATLWMERARALELEMRRL